MSGFPNRPSRTAFGPEKRNERRVQNPETELDSAEMNLDFWQVAGMGLVAPRVVIIALASGGSLPTPYSYQGIAWDPKGLLGAIPSVYNGVGDYEFNFAATYPDQRGVAIATSLKGGKVSAQTDQDIRGVVKIVTPTQAVVKLFDAAGAPVDADILLELW